MKTTKILALLAVWSVAAPGAEATPVRVSYSAVVTHVYGPHSAAFPIGSPAAIDYELDPLVPDEFPEDQVSGRFPGALLSLNVMFSGAGVFASLGPGGQVETIDNVPDPNSNLVSDQVFFNDLYSEPPPLLASSLIDGLPIVWVEVDFLSFVDLPQLPDLLVSDALPLSALAMIDSFVIFVTDRQGEFEATFVNFGPASIPEPGSLALLGLGLAGLNVGRRRRADRADRATFRMEQVAARSRLA